MSKYAKKTQKVKVSLIYQGELTPEFLAQVGAKLRAPLVSNLVAATKKSQTGIWRISIQPNCDVTYPAYESKERLEKFINVEL